MSFLWRKNYLLVEQTLNNEFLKVKCKKCDKYGRMYSSKPFLNDEYAEKYKLLMKSFNRPDLMRVDISTVWDSRNVSQ